MSNDSTFNFNSKSDYLNFAKEQNIGVYSDEPPSVTPQQLAKEVKAAETEFSQVIDKELGRINILVEEENDRIFELRRQNEDELTCPFCLEVIPAILREGEVLMNMSCCGVCCHHECFANWDMRRLADPTILNVCFYCRGSSNAKKSDRDKMNYFEELILTGSANCKSYALKEVADAYENGTLGKKRNLKKAFKYYQKAADLGNHEAQTKIAVQSYTGSYENSNELAIPKSQEKAMEMARRAVDQGNARAQFILGTFLMYDTTRVDEAATESYRLCSLSAYQGFSHGIMELERLYSRQYERLEEKANKTIQEQAETRECLLLSLYWAGKLVCNKKKDELAQHFLVLYFTKFSIHLEKAMMLWHVRTYFRLDPLTGCSHLPLDESIRLLLVRFITDEHFKDSLHAQPDDIWKCICVNCGKERNKEHGLKICARCRAFSYCSKECQVKHWKAGHNLECKKSHWIEAYFPNLRTL